MNFLYRLLALVASALLVASTLPSCAGTQDVASTLSQPLDSTIQHQLVRQLHTGKVKIKGHVTIQVGAGNVNAPKAQAPVAAGASQAQDYTRAGQQGGAVATAPGASAAPAAHRIVPSWILLTGSLVIVLLSMLYKYRKQVVAFVVG